jgi:hypothetical protein
MEEHNGRLLGVVTRNYEKVMGNVKKVKQTFRLKRIY